MPSKVFDRAMFQVSNQPLKADSGIMQGFDEDTEEMAEDEMMEELSQRKPNSPEILMNTLRGDMRSVDARYQELAEMVGEEAAMDTPPEVLALLQSQMAQQPMGIGALPAGQGMSPPPSMPPAAPMPTPEMMAGMPGMEQPQGFAQGGMVGEVPGYFGGGIISRVARSIQPQEGAMSGNATATAAGSARGGIGGLIGRIIGQMVRARAPQKTPEQIAAEQAEAARAAEAARIEAERQAAIALQRQRDEAFATPVKVDEATKRQNINQAFLDEYSRRFNQSLNVPRPAVQNPLVQTQGIGQVFTPMQSTAFTPPPVMYGNTPVPQNFNVNPYTFTQQIPQTQMFAEGGEVYYPPAENVYSKYSNFPEGVAAAGRNGDTMLAHITPEQEAYLTMLGDGKTINPRTGLPEHYMGMANLVSRGGSSLYNMGANLGQRAMPYLQAADAYAGRALFNPMLTAPTMQQTRSTLGTFGPKVPEGLELVYPTLTQRIGQAAAPVVERIAQTPAAAKVGAALTELPGASYVKGMMGDKGTLSADNNKPPVIPGDTATGWVAPEEEAPQATPIDYNKIPVAPTSSTEEPTKPTTTEDFIKASLAKTPKEGRLEQYMTENLPIFEKYLGGDKDYNQAQALFVLADAGLKLASRRRPGSTFASTLAESFSGVPAGLSAIAAQEEQAKRSIRGAALTAGLQQIAAEDKATAALQKELIKKLSESGELKPTDLGAGLTAYTDKKGQDAGMRVNETVTKSFLDSRFTPQLQKDKEGNVVGFDTPYARVGPSTQTINLDKDTRTRLAGEISRQELALSKLDDAIKYYTDAFGPKAFFSNLKNNVLVPITPLDPNILTEEQRTKIMTAMNTAVKAIARAGDTGNLAVAEQKSSKELLGDEPGKFFSDYQTALKRIMTVRTDMANQRLNTAAQLGWINQDVQLDVPNIGTPADPIPQDKLGYLKSLKTVNPNGQVYVNIGGKATPVLLSTLKD